MCSYGLSNVDGWMDGWVYRWVDGWRGGVGEKNERTNWVTGTVLRSTHYISGGIKLTYCFVDTYVASETCFFKSSARLTCVIRPPAIFRKLL